MHVYFRCLMFSFSVLSQEIGWEGLLQIQTDLFCVWWDVKPELRPSVNSRCRNLSPTATYHLLVKLPSNLGSAQRYSIWQINLHILFACDI